MINEIQSFNKGETNYIHWGLGNSDLLKFSGWGAEVGNWFGFFSQDNKGGVAVSIRLMREAYFENESYVEWYIKLPKAKFTIKLHDKLINNNKVFRSLELINNPKKISWLGDLVLRMSLSHEKGMYALIGDNKIFHVDKNYYNDTEDELVSLYLPNNKILIVRWVEEGQVFPPSFNRYLYIRDQPKIKNKARQWIIHARLLVDYPSTYVLRLWRNPFVFWNKGFGRYFINPNSLIRFWRAKEFGLSKRIQMNGLWALKPNQRMSIAILLETKNSQT